ncbi:MAG: tRNA pseudouridine(55) synthase TruB [Acidobacteria bacterium]|nr:MAG: tRNA pseudouridine(55) synthase TruB [Acidobacteriota bacterium]
MAETAQEISGVLVMDKPAGRTSHDVVAAVRRLIGIRQVGHFGTLDPFATGVLPLSVGRATRFSQFYLKSRKAYAGTIRFGFATDTYDATGQPASAPPGDAASPAVELDRKRLEEVMREFTGRILQTPPSFSAKRVGGTRAYKLARRHQPVELKPVEVEIYALELLGIEGERARFAVECSGGTYVRSLAHDIGRRVGCPAHLEGLRRTAVAEFSEDKALTLERLEGMRADGEWRKALIPLEALLPECAELVVGGREETNVRHGHHFELAASLRASRGDPPGRAPAATLLKILNPQRRLIAVARHVAGAVYHPDLVLV